MARKSERTPHWKWLMMFLQWKWCISDASDAVTRWNIYLNERQFQLQWRSNRMIHSMLCLIQEIMIDQGCQRYDLWARLSHGLLSSSPCCCLWILNWTCPRHAPSSALHAVRQSVWLTLSWHTGPVYDVLHAGPIWGGCCMWMLGQPGADTSCSIHARLALHSEIGAWGWSVVLIQPADYFVGLMSLIPLH